MLSGVSMPIAPDELKDWLLKFKKHTLLDDPNMKEPLAKIASQIVSNENIVLICGVDNLPHTYLLTATDRRLLIVSKSILGKEHSIDLSYKSIRDIKSKRGFIFPKVIIETKDGRIYRFGARDHEECTTFAQYVKNKIQYLL